MLPIQRSIKAFARGARSGVRMIRIASERKTSSKAAVNLLSRSWTMRTRDVEAVAVSVYTACTGKSYADYLDEYADLIYIDD